MEYFKITKASDRVYRITDPFGAICTLITGSEKALLADTGIGFGDIAGAVRTVTGLPVTAVNTHEHLDHSMGGRFFDKVYMDMRLFTQITCFEMQILYLRLICSHTMI